MPPIWVTSFKFYHDIWHQKTGLVCDKIFQELVQVEWNGANRMLGMIKCNFIDRSKETIISLYKSGQTSPGILLPDMESLLQEIYKVN